MNRNVRRALAAGKRKIERRLADGAQADGEAPMLTASNIHYEVADRARAIAEGGIGAVHRLVRKLKLPERIDARLELLKQHKPYHESDHVLNIAYNALCGGGRSTTSSIGGTTRCSSTRSEPRAFPIRRPPETSVVASRSRTSGR
jgi:hypothetical protein